MTLGKVNWNFLRSLTLAHTMDPYLIFLQDTCGALTLFQSHEVDNSVICIHDFRVFCSKALDCFILSPNFLICFIELNSLLPSPPINPMFFIAILGTHTRLVLFYMWSVKFQKILFCYWALIEFFLTCIDWHTQCNFCKQPTIKSICSADWGILVDVVGFCFLNLGSKYNPPEELVEWIEMGSKPVYVGFGSMV